MIKLFFRGYVVASLTAAIALFIFGYITLGIDAAILSAIINLSIAGVVFIVGTITDLIIDLCNLYL